MITSRVRTRVGIVVWARRAALARGTEMRLAEVFGSWVPELDGHAAKIVIARHARHHAFHATLWDSVVPQLHDVELGVDAADDPTLAPVTAAISGAGPLAEQVRAAFDVALPALVDVYRAWAADTSVVADRPVMRVLDLVLRDEEFDLREGRDHEALLTL